MRRSASMYAFLITIATGAWVVLYFTPPIATVAENIETRVVVVERYAGSGTGGTGFLIAPDIVLTAGHVATEIGSRSQVYTYDGKIAKVAKIWVGRYTATSGPDIGLLYLETPIRDDVAPVATNCAAEKLTYLDELVAASVHTNYGGFMAIPMTVAMRYVDLVEHDYNGDGKVDNILEDFVTVSIPTLFGGMSGSAVFDGSGRLVGILVRKFHVPVNPRDSHAAGIGHITAGPIVCTVIEGADTLRGEATTVDAAN